MVKKRLPASKRRAQILEKAAKLFSENGFSGMTIRTLAKSCRINEAMIYKHFPSKRKLYDDVIKMEISKLDINTYLQSIDRKMPFEELLQEMGLHILELGERNRNIQRLLLYGALEGHSSSSFLFISLRQPYVDYLLSEIRSRIEGGGIRSVDPMITARSFVGMVMDCSVSCSLWCDFGYGDFVPERNVKNNAGIFARGLLARPVSEQLP